jgi:LacI family transcriptional regulator
MSVRPRELRVLLMVDATQGFDREVLRGVGLYANSVSGWFFRAYGSAKEDHLCEKLIHAWQPTGVISLTRTWSTPLQLADRFGMAIVQAHELEEGSAAVNAPCIVTDARAVAETVADYFLGRGLDSIGHVGSDRAIAHRHSGYLLEAAEKRGMVFSNFFGEPRGDLDPDKKFRRWLSGLPRHTGLLASSDWFAWNAITECLDGGFKVPDDFAFIGTGDDSPWCDLAPVPLSSVALAGEKIGYRAASLLDQMMCGKPVPRQTTEIPPVGIVTRRSSEVIAAEDADIAAALRYIHDHATGGCTVKQVLQTVAIDRRRLERWCRQKLGRSPLDEIQRLRMDNVKRILAQTDERIEEVARRAGFGSATVLCRAFQRETGTTVSTYRRQFKRAKSQPA